MRIILHVIQGSKGNHFSRTDILSYMIMWVGGGGGSKKLLRSAIYRVKGPFSTIASLIRELVILEMDRRPWVRGQINSTRCGTFISCTTPHPHSDISASSIVMSDQWGADATGHQQTAQFEYSAGFFSSYKTCYQRWRDYSKTTVISSSYEGNISDFKECP